MGNLSKFNHSLSIIIPVYNEEALLAQSIAETYHSASSLLNEFEVIIVNDASTDGSQKIIDGFKKQYANITCITHADNTGFGGAIKSGLAACKFEFALCVPADSPVDNETLEAFLSACVSSDLVISYRLQRVGYTKVMAFNSKVYHLLIATLFRLNYNDFNWIHLYRLSIFRTINIQSKGIFMLAEVIIKAAKNKYSIKEIPVVQRQRTSGTASSTKLSSIINVLKELMLYLLRG